MKYNTVGLRKYMVAGLALGIVTLAVGCNRNLKQDKTRMPPVVPSSTWSFAVSGDSRNCGDVVMPSIAAGAKKDAAAFYWHLGDLRYTRNPDEDYLHQPEHRGKAPDKQQYIKDEWDDFEASQIALFAPLPYYVGIGNHEVIEPKTRAEFTQRFAQWLDAPAIRQQRLADSPADTAPRTYYHWIQGGVDFIYLDNASKDQFDAAQMQWLETTLQKAAANPQVRAVVAGMHEALPESLARDHSMSDWDFGAVTGQQAYTALLNLHSKTGKPVYLLASHSHFFMTDLYDTDFWRTHGGVLPGWIVGTGGAVRYALPDDPQRSRARDARTKIYGYLLGTVQANGSIDFVFQEVKRSDTPASVEQRYTPEFVDWCFAQNKDPKIP